MNRTATCSVHFPFSKINVEPRDILILFVKLPRRLIIEYEREKEEAVMELCLIILL
jgi:hypothetical protein